MNAHPNPSTRPSRKRTWIIVILLSSGLGALMAILATVLLVPRLGLLLEDVARAIRPSPAAITEPPSAIIRWYRQFADESAAQAAAKKQYYDRYVAWELTLDAVEPVGSYARTISKYPDTPPADPSHTIWAFFVDPTDAAHLQEQEAVAVRGKIVFINADNIFLGDCRLLDSKES
jgi:hypothetical protein